MITENFDAYFYAFGETATYTPVGGAPAQISVIFDMPSTNISLAMGEVAGSSPKATCKTSDTPNGKKGDLFTIRAVSYTVSEANPDGTGMSEFILRKT